MDEQLATALADDDLDGLASHLESGADPNSEYSSGKPLLFQAALQGKTEAAKLLIDHGADVNAETAEGAILVKAAAGGHEEIAEMLLEAGADANALGKEGANDVTSLFVAALAEDPQVVGLLLTHGADVDLADIEGNTALCVAAAWKPNLETLNLLLENGADVNHQNAQGDTALHLAVREAVVSNSYDIEIVDALIAGGAALDVENEKGQSPLDLAGKDTEIGQMLLQTSATD
jgi:ankyrin repeat protein